jgi:hypothetical protein
MIAYKDRVPINRNMSMNPTNRLGNCIVCNCFNYKANGHGIAFARNENQPTWQFDVCEDCLRKAIKDIDYLKYQERICNV